MDDLAQSNQHNQMKYRNITSKPTPTATATATRPTSSALGGIRPLSRRNLAVDGLKLTFRFFDGFKFTGFVISVCHF